MININSKVQIKATWRYHWYMIINLVINYWKALLISGCSLPWPGSFLCAQECGGLLPTPTEGTLSLPDLIWKLSLCLYA